MTEVNIKNFLAGLVSPQQVADYAIAKTLEQGKPSVNDAGRCMYRGPNGLKCAIGHIIPDSKYTPEMEGEGLATYGARTIAAKFFNADYKGEHALFLQKLQAVHDLAYTEIENTGNIFNNVLINYARKFYDDNNLIWPYDTYS